MFRVAKQVQQQAESETWCRQEHKQCLPLAIQEMSLKRIVHRSKSNHIANWLHKSSLCNSCHPVSSVSVLPTAKSCWKVVSQYLKSRHIRGGNTSICAHSDPDIYARSSSRASSARMICCNMQEAVRLCVSPLYRRRCPSDKKTPRKLLTRAQKNEVSRIRANKRQIRQRSRVSIYTANLSGCRVQSRVEGRIIVNAT